MRINLRYQILLFSDFSQVQNDTKTQESFLASWSSYNFNLKPLFEATIGPTGVISNQSRPSFISLDGSFSVNLYSDHLLIEAVDTDINVFTMMSFAEFVDKVLDICSRSSVFLSQKYKRVGVIRQMFYKDIDHKRTYSRFCNGIKFFDNLDMNDWSVFFPANKTLSDGRVVNATSRISHIKAMVRMDSKDQLYDGIATMTDINTLASNIKDNISWEEMKNIIKDIQKIEYDITNQTAEAIEEN